MITAAAQEPAGSVGPKLTGVEAVAAPSDVALVDPAVGVALHRVADGLRLGPTVVRVHHLHSGVGRRARHGQPTFPLRSSWGMGGRRN